MKPLLLTLFIAWCCAAPARADDGPFALPPGAHIVYDEGVICDTETQTEQFLAYDEDTVSADEIIEEVSALAGGTAPACAINRWAFVRGQRGKIVTDPKGRRWQLLHILVVEVATPDGMRKIKPMAQWTAMLLEPEDPA